MSNAFRVSEKDDKICTWFNLTRVRRQHTRIQYTLVRSTSKVYLDISYL